MGVLVTYAVLMFMLIALMMYLSYQDVRHHHE